MSRLQGIFIGMITIGLGLGGTNTPFAEDLPRPLSASVLEKDRNQDTAKGRSIVIDFDNVDIHIFIKYISEISGKNFVVDKAVQGNVTIISPTRISVQEAYKVFESVLEVHGFTAVETGSITKILPSARARSQNVEMLQAGLSSSPGDKVVTQLVPLKHSSPEDLKKILTPLVSQSSVIISHGPSGMLIITETLSNIQKLLGIIEALDIQSREDEVAVIPLKNGSAEALGKIFTTIYQRDGMQKKAGEEGLATGTIKVVPYDRVNGLIVMASARDMARIRSLIATLDKEVARPEGNIHVYYLQNATAVELAKVLGTLPEKQGGDDPGKTKAAAISKDVRILADEETNSLVITAAKDEYAVLEDVIKKLDIPRRMVYLEALILEVDADKSFDVGVQWAAGGTFSADTGALVGGFAGEAGYDMLGGINSEEPKLPAGFSLGVLKQGIRIGNVTFPNIAAILRAYKTDTDINIISTPQILTTDNKKAEISVGENVPYITSRNTTASEQDYTQYEYKDVATKLSIIPHINQAGSLRLEIATEVVRIKENNADTPTTYKRTANTTVVLNDKDTVVIGGIIGHDSTENEWKIPVLGDIPVLGWLFKTHSTTNAKTNMFIFITPRIVRNPSELAAVTAAKQEVMGGAMTDASQKDKAQQINQLLAEAYENLQAGKLEEAKGLLQKVLDIDPQNPFALMNMAVISEKEGKTQQALALYRAVIAQGSAAVAGTSSDSGKRGASLLEIAREGIERLEKNGVSQ
ncbi:MAG: type II secretion system secretin GspD [Desulforhopalus sp.]|nr:type II secretion system secretin GspD [Desulforhopalus sp.]